MTLGRKSAGAKIELAPDSSQPFEEFKTNSEERKLIVSLSDMKRLFLFSGLLYAFMVLKQLKVNFMGSMSRVTGKFADMKVPKFILVPVLRIYSAIYGVDLEEPEIRQLRDFSSFNAFFTRKLKKGIRVVESAEDPYSLCSP